MTGFSIPLDKLAAKAKEDLGTVVQKSTLNMFRAVDKRSPVDTGRFKANWNCSQGSIDATTTDSTDQTRGTAEANKALSFAAGGVVFFTNSLPYAYRLEYEGWSAKSPNGMVRITVTEFDQYVRKAIA